MSSQLFLFICFTVKFLQGNSIASSLYLLLSVFLYLPVLIGLSADHTHIALCYQSYQCIGLTHTNLLKTTSEFTDIDSSDYQELAVCILIMSQCQPRPGKILIVFHSNRDK